jgi:hypothetical protein
MQQRSLRIMLVERNLKAPLRGTKNVYKVSGKL